MTSDCLTDHRAYLKKWSNGIRVCLLCAAKHEMAQDAKTCLLKAKLFDNSNTLSHNTPSQPTMEKVMEKTRCPKCRSTLVYFRMKLAEFVCRSCGHTWNKETKTE